MKIKSIKVENFRLLKNSSLDMTDGLTLIVGKNNTGKTSFVVLLEKFLSKPNPSFNFSDLPVSVRNKLYEISEETNIDELSIRLCISVEYTDEDDLKHISNFMLDLEPDKSIINIMFEARLERDALLHRMPIKKEGIDDAKYITEKRNFIERNFSKFIKTSIYAYDDSGYEGNEPYYLHNREELEEKEFKDVSNLLNFQVIHARRNVASSDETGKSPLSAVTTQFFKKLNDSNDERLEQVRMALIDIDNDLETQYSNVFSGFLSSAANFLNLDSLKVISNIEASSLIGSSSKVIYGTAEEHLPENLNGLGYLNILYLLLQIEMMRKEFEESSSDINLLFIEEPEAHTHPQMQSIFSKKIREVVNEIKGLQAIITTHSSYIVANSDFDNIRYLLKDENSNVEFKNFHTELAKKYKEEQGNENGANLYKFLEQYLKIQNAELFFADKAIFIEGTTERILLPWFIKKYDEKCDEGSQPISSQNISIIEAGANAKAFAPFLEFIGIKSLIVTDLDSTKSEVKSDKNGQDKTSYVACPVSESSHTSNETLKHFFSAPDLKDPQFPEWFNKLKCGKLAETASCVKVVYQTKENSYQARSFEDVFFNSNKAKLKRVCAECEVLGLKNKDMIATIEMTDIYELTNKVINKKSDFAASLLYLCLTGEADWDAPEYINEGLKWISQ
ncbi:ATP-dependent endonuclease [Providencia manganoxydans]|uniref:ATP-dependent nuclease n=1 Tax=Providencia manganoxydans TaxID=2923283 RepID=UPI0034E5C184